MKQTNTFFLHIGNNHFPGYTVKQPFYAEIEYSYYKDSIIEVLNVSLPFKAVGTCNLSHNLAEEIKEAAKQHHITFYTQLTKAE